MRSERAGTDVSTAAADHATTEYFEHDVHEYSVRRVRPAIEFVNEHATADASLIDIGCGVGNVLRHIAEATGIRTLVGLDVSERCLELTRQNVDAEVHRASVLDEATVERFRDSFDFAVMAAVLHHLVGSTRRQSYRAAERAVANALALVKPAGFLIVMEPTFTPAATLTALFWTKTATSKILRRRLSIGGYWNNIGAPVVSYYSSAQVQAMLRARPGVDVVLVDEAPQQLSRLASALLAKSNTTVVASRRAP